MRKARVEKRRGEERGGEEVLQSMLDEPSRGSNTQQYFASSSSDKMMISSSSSCDAYDVIYERNANTILQHWLDIRLLRDWAHTRHKAIITDQPVYTYRGDDGHKVGVFQCIYPNVIGQDIELLYIVTRAIDGTMQAIQAIEANTTNGWRNGLACSLQVSNRSV
jgi:hypothetical protein